MKTGPESLSPREAEIIDRASRGLLQKMIAEELGISLGTLKTYIMRILVKLQARSIQEATFKWGCHVSQKVDNNLATRRPARESLKVISR